MFWIGVFGGGRRKGEGMLVILQSLGYQKGGGGLR